MGQAVYQCVVALSVEKLPRKKAYMIVMITKNIRDGGMRKDKRIFKGERRINSQSSTKSRVVRSCELKVES